MSGGRVAEGDDTSCPDISLAAELLQMNFTAGRMLCGSADAPLVLADASLILLVQHL